MNDYMLRDAEHLLIPDHLHRGQDRALKSSDGLMGTRKLSNADNVAYGDRQRLGTSFYEPQAKRLVVICCSVA